MMTFYCDESDDGQTYALAGWLAVPSAWDRFDPAWRSMLASLTMPDGSPCPVFHAAEIINRRNKDSRFKGWSAKQEADAFSKATDVIVDTSGCSRLWPLGVALSVPSTLAKRRDAVWRLLFMKTFSALVDTFREQGGISFVFDSKPAVEAFATDAHFRARKVLAQHAPEYLTSIEFCSDHDRPGLQAADLLVYSWRKRITAGGHLRDKPVHRAYTRMRSARGDGALWRYGLEVFRKALESDPESPEWIEYFLSQPPTHRD